MSQKCIVVMRVFSLVAVTGIAAGFSPVVWAQAGEESAIEEVTVTGSRLRQVSGYEAPTPVTILSAADMEVRGTTNVADLINELPAFTGTLTPASSNLNSRQNGRNGLDIRGLGINRNLVLVNGRRVVPFDEFGIVDINAIPSVAIERVEMVTGGASAAWGSDAVSGVINIIFEEDLEGFKLEAQYGGTSQSDNENSRISAAFGRGFGDDRGHFMFAAEWFDTDGVPEARARDWSLEHWGFLSNPANTGPNDGIPAFRLAPNSTLFLASPNGVTLPGMGLASDNIEFFPDGTWGPRDLGVLGGNLMEGGSGANLTDNLAIVQPSERKSILGTLSYQMNDDARFFVEASYTESESVGALIDAFAFGIAVNSGNPFIPPDLQALMEEAGDPVLVLFRTFEEFPPISSRSKGENKRIVAGIDGEFGADGRWWYEASAQYGENQFNQTYDYNLLPGNLAQAALAVIDPVTGLPVCAANAGGANAAPGCVPIDLFGKGAPSQASLDYITRPFGFSRTNIEQTVLSVTVGGELFEGWAGPTAAAFGGEYRDESLGREVDENSDALAYSIINAQPLSGSFDVKEAFAEVNVPLHETLALNAAGRYADYSTVGSTFSWKGGLVWDPIESLRFRGSVSRDIRAPSIGETFIETLLLFETIANPFTGTSDFVEIFNTGNDSLGEERALTKTVGVVWSPQSADFRFSVDWYNIDLADAIGQLTEQQISDRCFEGLQEFCDLITFNPDMTIHRVINSLLNLGIFEVEGLDFSATYLVEAGPGTFGINLLGNHVIRKDIAPSGAEPIDVSGEVGGWNDVGAPRWKGRLGFSYDLDNWGVYGQLRYIDSGKFNILFGPEDLSDSDNSIPSRQYVDISSYYNFRVGKLEHLQLYAGISNLLDKDPPVAPVNFISNYGTNPGLYDVIGRQWYAGVRLEY